MNRADALRQIVNLMKENKELRGRSAELETALKESATVDAPPHSEKEWYTPMEAAKCLSRSKSFPDYDRIQKSPAAPFRKDERRTVSYHVHDQDAFLEARKRKKHS